ncbi:MAG TPA: hypothetical protein VH561_10675 [Micromonosporaceae bacterium]
MESGQTNSGQMQRGQMAPPSAAAMLARGGSVLAASLLFLLGVYHFFSGIAGFARRNFYTVGANYPYHLNSTGWGWLHVILGVLLAVTGIALLARNTTWARPVAILLCVASVVANFFFLVYFPLWAILMVALSVFCIWALARDGSEIAQQQAQAAMGERAAMGGTGTQRYASQQQYGAQQYGQQQAGAGAQQHEHAGQGGSYVSSGTYGTSQSGQRWPENASGQQQQQQPAGGRNWSPSDLKDSASRLGDKAQEQAQSGARSAGQAGRNAAEEAAERARQGMGQGSGQQTSGRGDRSR